MRPNPDSAFYCGTSNIVLPVPNKQAFPEAYKNASRLTYYGSLFSSLEVNSSFYKIPQARTTGRWTTEVPGNFRFTFKLNRDITHGKAGPPEAALVDQFMTAIQPAGTHAGALLIQFPASVTHNQQALERLLTMVRKHETPWSLCVEFRHPSWYRDSVYRMLEAYDTAIVIHDKSGAMLQLPEPWTDFAYLRYHGPKGDYRGSYDFPFLERQAAVITELLQNGKTVYAYFNNTMGSAVFDALTLQELITGSNTFDSD